MHAWKRSGSLVGLALLAAAGFAAAPPEPSWRISGELAEACTCRVPCTCQFGEGPSPGPGCRSLITLSIEKGRRGDVLLDGTKLAFVRGGKSTVVYVDAATPALQKDALRAIAARMTAGAKSVTYREAAIRQTVSAEETRAGIGDAGSFEADMLIGADGKTPVVVENQGDVNIARLEKGKTRSLKYGDSDGNAIDAKETNSDRGHFDWTDRSASYF